MKRIYKPLIAPPVFLGISWLAAVGRPLYPLQNAWFIALSLVTFFGFIVTTFLALGVLYSAYFSEESK